MQDKFEQLKDQALAELAKIKNSQALRDLETKILGRKGELSRLLKSVAELDEAERKRIGQLANEAKQEIIGKFRELKELLAGDEEAGAVDPTMPGPRLERGHLSPISRIQYELEDVFTSMGFMVLDGPELESDFYNFEGLNIPAHHPARDMQDTFYVSGRMDPDGKPMDTVSKRMNTDGGRMDTVFKRMNTDGGRMDTDSKLVMRTHTSPMQVRAMRRYGAPLRCVVPGRVFRSEATDATHDTTFDQIEGLMVGEDISLANLVSVLREMLGALFGQDVKIRVRPGYFPFVEPGLEVDMACTICGGDKCPACKHSGWLEMIGAGMVHPNVLKHGGLDPAKYSGFAFGLGLTRLAMMRYGINDIRMFNSGDLRFVEQF